MLGVAEGRRLGVDGVLLLSHVGVPQYAQPLRVSGHDPVLDSVVNHFDEVPGAVGTAMQITLFGGAVQLLASRRARHAAHARRQGREDRIEVLDHVVFAADHHAVAALQAPHTAAGPHVHVMDLLRRQFLGAPDVIDVIGIAAVDEDVVRLEIGQQIRRWFRPRRPPGPSTIPPEAFRASPQNPAAKNCLSAFS